MADIVTKASDTEALITTDTKVELSLLVRQRDDLSQKVSRVDQQRNIMATELARFNKMIADAQAAGVKETAS